MKEFLLVFVFSVFLLVPATHAQVDKSDSIKKQGEDLLKRSQDEDAAHNLDVAWQYFKNRKAYQSSLMRMEETLVANPTFSRIDEVLYISGMSSYYLLNGKGNQKLDPKMMTESEKERFTPERLREDAEAYLGMLINEHANSKYAQKAKKYYDELKKKK